MPDPPTTAARLAPLELTGAPLSPFEVESVARSSRPVELADEALANLNRAHDALQHAITSDAPIYGVNTGFGSLSRQRIAHDKLPEVQRNLLRSHAAGAGDPLPVPIVRAMLLLLAASLARGRSGVRPGLAQAVVGLLNAGITPVVPSLGSVGASGDLAPLAHASLNLIGEGEAFHGGARKPAAQALADAGLEPIGLAPKDGLALINGTHLMAAHAALIVVDAERLFDAACVACATSIDACRATDAFLDPRVYEARNQPGAQRAAARLRELLKGSGIIISHRDDDPRVQDPYSLRCSPLILGAVRISLDNLRKATDAELGAVSDNPLVFPADDEHPEPTVVSAGAFHGVPIALPLDQATLALAQLANAAERRTYYMLGAGDPEMRLNPHLSPDPGVQSGFMITQYTAAAACNEIATLAAPATAINIPTCAGMEDINSFGPRAADQARRALELTETVVAIELLCAAQAVETHRPLASGVGVERAVATIRERVEPLTVDRSPAPDIEAIESLIRAGRF
jgi:histidine ammonia-lyase